MGNEKLWSDSGQPDHSLHHGPWEQFIESGFFGAWHFSFALDSRSGRDCGIAICDPHAALAYSTNLGHFCNEHKKNCG